MIVGRGKRDESTSVRVQRSHRGEFQPRDEEMSNSQLQCAFHSKDTRIPSATSGLYSNRETTNGGCRVSPSGHTWLVRWSLHARSHAVRMFRRGSGFLKWVGSTRSCAAVAELGSRRGRAAACRSGTLSRGWHVLTPHVWCGLGLVLGTGAELSEGRVAVCLVPLAAASALSVRRANRSRAAPRQSEPLLAGLRSGLPLQYFSVTPFLAHVECQIPALDCPADVRCQQSACALTAVGSESESAVQALRLTRPGRSTVVGPAVRRLFHPLFLTD
jgi:hypothetical protein